MNRARMVYRQKRIRPNYPSCMMQGTFIYCTLNTDNLNTDTDAVCSRFSEILMKEGFTGGFWAPPWDMGKMHHSGTLLPPTVRTLTMPWPKHRRPFLREFHYPARLVTYSPVGFSLTLPGPSILRLHKLLKSYFNLRPTLNGLLRMLFIWTRSHRMDELTTQCLALLVIRYMQESRKVPNLMDLDHALLYKDHARRTTESKMWMPYQYLLPRVAGVGEGTPRESHVVPTQLEHTVVDYTNFSSFDRKPGSQFWDFLSFWRNGLPIAKTFALSVGHNKYLKRQLPPLRNTELENEIPYILNSSEKLIQDQGFDPAATTYDPRWQPISWPLQPLVVQDPFIPTYVSIDRVTLIYSN
ncbi:hypothetical protein PILCRDRAFT_635000 [Piloderma croceum F 1598]|uniref:Uncharacterized protein n=1 Tax=Piloderma croceum (strain F 1598) TaxID=765440 RepID=A0A0C3BHR2_PILCF|nr:hypothetical protein PILCRDRAFT_635000 [Piloderma croceum F 1598]